MSGLLRGLLLAAALTPLCWIGVLMALSQTRKTGLVGPGLGEFLNQLERGAWAIGGLLALGIGNVMNKAGSALFKGFLLTAVVSLACWLGLRMAIGRGRYKG